MIERNCIMCKRKIKRNAKWANKDQTIIHRKCWLAMRSFNDRCFDWLFCGDRQHSKEKELRVKPLGGVGK